MLGEKVSGVTVIGGDKYKFILMTFAQHLHVICKIVFILDVYLKSMRYFIKVVFTNTTYEAGRLKK